MQQIQSIDYPDHYNFLWQRLNALITKRRVPHGMIFCGNAFVAMQALAFRFAASLNCISEDYPCMQCRDCNLILKSNHPNLYVVNSDDSSIKIDDIRLLKDFVFTAVDKNKYKIIILEHADSLTNAASNALLKLLEEPTANTVFILTLRNIQKLPLTILSRCQQYYFEDFTNDQTLSTDLNEKFTNFLSQQISPVMFAEELKDYALSDVLDFLYEYSVCNIKHSLGLPGDDYPTANLGIKSSKKLFSTLDHIANCKKNIQLGLNLNEKLVLEQILIKYL